MTLRKLPPFGDLFTLEIFVKMVQAHALVDGDGTGYFATATKYSDIIARPSTIENGFPMNHTGPFTHVLWCNK